MEIPKPYDKCSLNELWLRKCYTCGFVYMKDSSCFWMTGYSCGEIEYDNMCINCRSTRPYRPLNKVKATNRWAVVRGIMNFRDGRTYLSAVE